MKFKGRTPKGMIVTGKLFIDHLGPKIFDGKKYLRVAGMSIRPLREDDDFDAWKTAENHERGRAS